MVMVVGTGVGSWVVLTCLVAMVLLEEGVDLGLLVLGFFAGKVSRLSFFKVVCWAGDNLAQSSVVKL